MKRLRRPITFVLLLLAAAVCLAADGAAAHGRTGGATLLLLGFVLLILVPFVPGLFEVYWPRDRYPLPLNVDYVKDPRYLGRSARAILRAALGGLTEVPGQHAVRLSRDEQVDVSLELDVPRHTALGPLQYVAGSLRVGEEANCARDVHCGGNARLEAGATLRALACDGDAFLAPQVRITRWIDVAGDLQAGIGADLGAHACAGGRLETAHGVRFTRMTGAPVCTTGYAGDVADDPPAALYEGVDLAAVRDVTDVAHRTAGDLTVAPGDDPDRHRIVLGDLLLRAGARLRGSVKVYGAVRLEAGAVILGDVFAEGDVELASGARVRGNVFSQETVRLGTGCRVGRTGGVKSVVARRGVVLAGDVAVHGHVETSREGRVRCPASD
jgi:predicted acyltransferase (DUF342 family)